LYSIQNQKTVVLMKALSGANNRYQGNADSFNASVQALDGLPQFISMDELDGNVADRRAA